MRKAPERYCPVSESAIAAISCRLAGGYEMTTGISSTRAKVHNVIGAADRLFIVLDHQHGIAKFAQSLERSDELIVITSVQPDRRLVEHVQHAAQPRADLRSEPNALRFAAGKRCRRARTGSSSQDRRRSEIRSRAPISSSTREAISRCRGVSCERISSTTGRASLIGSSTKSAIERPAIFTARLSGRRRRSPQTAATHGRHVLRHPLAIGVGT